LALRGSEAGPSKGGRKADSYDFDSTPNSEFADDADFSAVSLDSVAHGSLGGLEGTLAVGASGETMVHAPSLHTTPSLYTPLAAGLDADFSAEPLLAGSLAAAAGFSPALPAADGPIAEMAAAISRTTG
jgi:hypothetical protein